jgi:DNA ligase D
VEVEAPAADGGTRTVTVSNPTKVYFSARGETKLDLVNYLLAVGEGALRGVHLRPTVMRRYPDGAEGKSFFQKRVPDKRPDWLETATVTFPSGNTATELCPTDVSHLVWAANLGCLGFDPWPVRRFDLHHPDELRVDLDPQPGVPFATVRAVALAVHELLDEVGLVGWPKTSGSRGIHILVRIHPNWGFDDVRRGALALARELARRRPDTITAEWWKEDRGDRVFVDYNQNARDRTVSSAYSVRANPEARVSAPLRWDEVADVEPNDLTLATMPRRFAELGDLHGGIDDAPCSLDALLALADRHAAEGMGDAPLPPYGRREG